MIRYNYNHQISPPAPFVHLTIERPGPDGMKTEIPAQLDCAADITVIPWHVVEELELVQFGEQSVGGFGGYTMELPTFLIQLGLRGQPLCPVKVRVRDALCTRAGVRHRKIQNWRNRALFSNQASFRHF